MKYLSSSLSAAGLIFFSFLLWLTGVPANSAAPPSPPISVLEAVAPVYPQEAVSPKAIMGDVRVDVQVDSRGAVASAHAVSGHPALYKVTESAARRWVFSSAGADAGMRAARLLFRFRFVDYRTSADELGPIFKPPFEVEVRAKEPVIVDGQTK
jgi:hypothetical protein